MGWWSEEVKGKELLIGDAPLDAVGDMLDRFVAEYLEEWERKPTPEELAKTLEIAIASRLSDLLSETDGKELSAVTIKLKKQPKRQPYTPGDFFAVPLPDNKGYGFGRLKDVFDNMILLDLLDVYSTDVLSVDELVNAPVFEEVMSYINALADYRWTVLGHVPLPGYKQRPREEDDAAYGHHFWRLEGTVHGTGAVAICLEMHHQKMGRIS